MNSKQTKAALVAGCLLTSVFAILWWVHYPVTMLESEGYVTQFPIGYWVLLLIAFALLYVIVLWADSPLTGFLAAALFYLSFFSYKIFFYLDMSDSTSVSVDVLHLESARRLQVHGSEFIFSYAQWPNHYILSVFAREVWSVDIRILMKAGTFIYLVLLATVVCAFIYRYSREPFHIFSGSMLFLVIVFNFLNSQFVPQMLAMILMMYLFAIHSKTGSRWRLVKLTLYVALVFAHPFFFVFYVIAVGLAPFCASLFSALPGDEPQPLVRQLFGAIVNLRSFFQSFAASMKAGYSDRTWMSWMVTMFSIYAAAYSFRFLKFQSTSIHLLGLGASERGDAGVFSVLRHLPGPIGSQFESGTEAETAQHVSPVQGIEPLYDLAPADLHVWSRNATIALIFLIGAVCLIGYLRAHWVEPFGVAVGLSGMSYFLFGFVRHLLARRALQILLLPVVVGIAAFRRQSLALRVFVAICLLTSPILLVNDLTSASVTGGSTVDDYASNQAGLTVEEYSTGDIVIPDQNIYPIRDDQSVQPVRNVLLQGYEPRPGDVVLYAPIMRHYTRHHGYDCPYERAGHNVVMDNGAPVLFISESDEFGCSFSN